MRELSAYFWREEPEEKKPSSDSPISVEFLCKISVAYRFGHVQILIERMKELGKKMKQLERRKFAAVEVEDYDTAKLCKVCISSPRHILLE